MQPNGGCVNARSVLFSMCVGVVSACATGAIDPATSQPPVPTTTPTVPTTPTTPDDPTGARSNAGSMLGMNIGVPEFMGDALFVDALRNTPGFRDLNTWALVPTDAQGWPLSVADGQPVVAPLFGEHGAPHFPSGPYVLLYEGTGTVEVWAEGASFGPVEEQADGSFRVAVNLDPSQFPPEEDALLAIMTSSASDPVRNVRFILPGFEATYATQPFNPHVLDKWRRYGLVRPMHPQSFWDFPDTELVPDVDWADRMQPNDFRHGRRWSYEAMIDLANALDADLWLSVPHTATLAYTAEMARLVSERLESERSVFIEFANECWNAYSNTHVYASEQGVAANLYPADAPGDVYQAGLRWCAVQTVEHTNRFRDVFAETQSADRVVRVMGGFIGNPWLYVHLDDDGGLEGALYESRANTGRPAHLDVDAIAVATYFGGELGSEENTPYTASWTLDDVFAYFSAGTVPAGTPTEELDGGVPGTVAMVQQWSDDTAGLGLELLAYEGGPHLVTLGSPEVDALYVQALRDPRMADLMVQLLDGAQQAGLTRHTLFVSAEPLIEDLPWARFGFVEHGLADPAQAWRWQGAERWLDTQPSATSR